MHSKRSIINHLRAFAQDTRGLTLVEIAIVVAIIGVLVGGALVKGAEIMEKARSKAVVTDVENFRTAVGFFRDKHSQLPGDFSRANRYLQGREGVEVLNGNGNSIIDNEQEQLHFWQHLALDGLLRGIQVLPDAEPIFGETVPSASIGGGYSVTFEQIHRRRGHWVRLSSSPVFGIGEDGVLTPAQAFEIDRSMDNGTPLTGDVLAVGEECIDEQGEYNLANDGPVCVLYFSLR